MEALRLYPRATGTARVLSKKMTFCGHEVFEGANVSTSHYAMHRRPFNSDRFHQAESNNFQAFMPFFAGQHKFLGRQFAEMEVKVNFAKMFKRLTFELLPDKKASLIGENVFLVPAGDIGFIRNERLL